MGNKLWQIAFLFILTCFYSLLFYFILTYQYKLDFSSFYSATLALISGENPYSENPYTALFTTYLPVAKKLSANLNPPIVLWLFTPLAKLSYHNALIIWSILSFIFGLIGVGIAFTHAFSLQFLRKNWLNLYFIYLSLFAIVMNTAIAQFGTFLLFFIMLGYHFYLKKRNFIAGILWGFIIAIKFFPALLFFYVLKQRRYQVLLAMLISFLLVSLIPLLIYGPAIYTQYYSLMSSILWYGDSWNGSIYGFIFRLFIDTHNTTQNLVPIKILYLVLFFISLLVYLKNLGPNEKNRVNHQPFCLTLAMMLLMSPLGWLYYFHLLIFPFCLLWMAAIKEENASIKTIFLWLLCLFLLNFPMDYVGARHMPNFLVKINYFSFYFYGLLLLIYLLIKKKTIFGQYEVTIDEKKQFSMPAILTILAFGMLIPSLSFIMRLFSIPGVPQ